MDLMNYGLSGFGNRFGITMDAYGKSIKHSAYGIFTEITSELVCGVKTEYDECYLPFCKAKDKFTAVYMENKLNSVIYRGVNKVSGYDIEMKITSPFIPKDEMLVSAPLFLVDIKINRNYGRHRLKKNENECRECEIIFGLRNKDIDITADGHYERAEYTIDMNRHIIAGDFDRRINIKSNAGSIFAGSELIYSPEYSCTNDDGLFHINAADGTEVRFIWTAYAHSDVFSADGNIVGLKYKKYWNNAYDIAEYAEKNIEEIEKKSNFFNSLADKSSLSKSWKELMGFAFQNLKMNTAWLDTGLLTVWEGNCMYNLTVDVEYNNALFYLMFWPELMKPMFERWRTTDADFISHDIGLGFEIDNTQHYRHNMQIEENCNFILMLYAYYKVSCDVECLNDNRDISRRLVNYILNADKNGDGIPDIGVANTIDDGIPEVQYSAKQTYIAVKSASALWAYKELWGDTDGLLQKRIELIMNSLNQDMWNGEYYELCGDKCCTGLNGDERIELFHRHDSSIYTANGLLYLMMFNREINFIDKNRLRSDIITSYKKCLTQYGCNHSENSQSVWISQNIWRDFAAAYLGIDLLDNADRYWDFEKLINMNENSALYTDTYGSNFLWEYPRGAVSFGVLAAMLHMQLDADNNKLYVSPLRRNAELPIIFNADWKECKVQWVSFENGEQVIKGEGDSRDLEIIIENI